MIFPLTTKIDKINQIAGQSLSVKRKFFKLVMIYIFNSSLFVPDLPNCFTNNYNNNNNRYKFLYTQLITAMVILLFIH